MRAPAILFPPALVAAGLLAGCAGAPPAAEQSARRQLNQVGGALLPGADRPALPVLAADAPPGEFVRFAVLHHPAVRAAYYDWRAAVEAIAPVRALPDPVLALEADVARTLMTFMPGLMFDLMSTGKRAAMGREANAAGEVARRAFVTAVLRVAAETRKAWVELAYATEVGELYGRTIMAVEESLALANASYQTTRGMAGFDPQIRLQNLAAQHHAHHLAFADRLVAARARLKSALGLLPTDSDPPWPQPTLTRTPLPADEELWRLVRTSNPELAKMRAMVDMAVAGAAAARAGNAPNFAAGAMVDLLATPLMVRPSASVSLPVWREKIAGSIAAAETRREAAVARVDAEQLNLAAELAQMIYMVREADRMLAFIDETALPNLTRGVAYAEAGARSGSGSPGMISETRMMALDLRHERIELLRQRETAAVDLALLTAAVAPPGIQLLAQMPQ